MLERVAAEEGIDASELLAEVECVLSEQREQDRHGGRARRSLDEGASPPDPGDRTS